MFRKSRIKIVALLMAILVLTLLGTIAVIYGVSYREMSQENRQMLELYAREYLENGGLPESDDDVRRMSSDENRGEAEEKQGGAGESQGDAEESQGGAEESQGGAEESQGGAEESQGGAEVSQGGAEESQGGAEESQGGAEESQGGAEESQDDAEENRNDAAGDDLPDISRRRLELSTFYSVVFDADGSVIMVNNDDPSQLSDEVLTEMAQTFLDSGKFYGISRNMIYLISGEDYTLVSMMDNTVISESIYTLLRYTVIFGLAAVAVVLILSIFLSGWIIRPLEDNYKRQNQFISDAGHELKTPVSTISTNAELLGREIGSNRWLDNIRYENDRMMEIVRSLLDLLRAESTQSHMERIDLGRVVTAGTLPFEGRAFEQGFELESRIEEGVFILGDASQLGKLVSILIDNAFAHTYSSGRIQVLLESGNGTLVGKGGAVLTVSNEGDPIPPESMDKIFDRFYRVDTSRTVSDEDGTAHYGLGLSIAKAIATAHRARIAVNCEGGITSFTVTFKTVSALNS